MPSRYGVFSAQRTCPPSVSDSRSVATESYGIEVHGTRNLIRGNMLQAGSLRDEIVGVWMDHGIVFYADGNFFGLNIAQAYAPFITSGTDQIDLGGNVNVLD